MKCPNWSINSQDKNGQKKGKQKYICVECDGQFIDGDETYRGYSDQLCR